jgi:glycosyltransferase involved in cell wall biosynthesis
MAKTKNLRIMMMGLTSPLEGGSERVIYELSSRMSNCTVLTQRGSICRKKIGIPLLKKPTLLRNLMFAFLARFYTLFLLLTPWKKYDVVHIHENLLYPCAIPLSWRYKVVVTVHGMKGFKFYDNKFFWFFFKQGLKAADKVIAVSLADKRLLDEELKNVEYVPNGVDLSIYKKAKAGLIDKKITFIGRIHEQKGIVYLLEAFDKLKGQYPDYKLEIIGDINDYAKQLMEKFPDKRIIWRGFISDRKEIARSLKSAFCITLPSLWEGLPLTLFEALASSRPVIVSDIDAFKDVVKDEVIFCKAKDSADLAEKIGGILDNVPRSAELGRLGEKAARAYDWKGIANKMEAEYEGKR